MGPRPLSLARCLTGLGVNVHTRPHLCRRAAGCAPCAAAPDCPIETTAKRRRFQSAVLHSEQVTSVSTFVAPGGVIKGLTLGETTDLWMERCVVFRQSNSGDATCRHVSVDCREKPVQTSRWFKAIHSVILLLSPSPRHEGVSLVTDVCTTMANGGKSECRTSTTLSGRGQGRSSTGAALLALERAREWALLKAAQPTWGLPCEGVVPERPVAPLQVAGMTPSFLT